MPMYRLRLAQAPADNIRRHSQLRRALSAQGARRRRDRRRQRRLAHQVARRRRPPPSGPRRSPRRSGTGRGPCRRRRTRRARWSRAARRGRRCRARRARRRAARAGRCCSGPTKPIASSTSSHGQLDARCPATGSKPAVDELDLDQRAAPRTLPSSSPRKRSVLTGVDPLAALLVRRRRPGRSSGRSARAGRSGRSSGGRGRISSWVTEAAPWRCAVPRQSAPVSPPPMITTCLPAARDRRLDRRSPSLHLVGRRQVLHRLVDAVELAAGHRQVARHAVAPPASTIGVVAARAARSAGDVDRRRRRRCGTRCPRPASGEPPVEVALLHLELGDAVAQQAADAVGPLEDRDGRGRPG